MDLKWNTIIRQKLRTTWMVSYMDQWLWEYICLYNCGTCFLRIKNNTTEDYIHKCNGRPFREEKKWYKIIIVTVVESTENVYHVKRQNLHFAHALHNKRSKKKKKKTVKERTFGFRNNHLWTGLGRFYFLWAKTM